MEPICIPEAGERLEIEPGAGAKVLILAVEYGNDSRAFVERKTIMLLKVDHDRYRVRVPRGGGAATLEGFLPRAGWTELWHTYDFKDSEDPADVATRLLNAWVV